MKLFQIVILVLIAGFIVQSNPYGLDEQYPDGKNKKSKKTDTLFTNPDGQGNPISIEFSKGKKHNHPVFAIWIEDTAGNYVQTLYVAKSIATSIFNYADPSEGRWSNGVVRRPAALPYWSHKRGIVAEDGLYMPSPETAVPDAYSGATPKNNCILITRADKVIDGNYCVLLEVNQPWDWNNYWTNNKYPENDEYKTSAQPAVVYKALIQKGSEKDKFIMEVVGHSHYAGEDGSLTSDVSTLSTALDIIRNPAVYLRK